MNMTSLDLLYLSLAAGFIALVVMLNIILYNVWRIVRSLRISIESMERLSGSVVMVQNRIKSAVLNSIKGIITRFK